MTFLALQNVYLFCIVQGTMFEQDKSFGNKASEYLKSVGKWASHSKASLNHALTLLFFEVFF